MAARIFTMAKNDHGRQAGDPCAREQDYGNTNYAGAVTEMVNLGDRPYHIK
jgi:hypothetical protein